MFSCCDSDGAFGHQTFLEMAANGSSHTYPLSSGIPNLSLSSRLIGRLETDTAEVCVRACVCARVQAKSPLCLNGISLFLPRICQFARMSSTFVCVSVLLYGLCQPLCTFTEIRANRFSCLLFPTKCLYQVFPAVFSFFVHTTMTELG